jgi:regulator of nucleoside diphosphate kinase
MTRSIISTDDFRRLKVMLRTARMSGRRGAYVNALERELRRADLVEPVAVPADVVTMNSRLRVREAGPAGRGRRHVLTIVYPHHRGRDPGDLSALAPLGTALLGRHVGDHVRCRATGRPRVLAIEAILYQPEAAGDLHL